MGLHERAEPDDVFRVLFVCTANRIRSPMAERLLRQGLTTLWGPGYREMMTVSSAGTRVGHPTGMDPFAARVLTEHGIDAAEFVRRPLTPDIIGQADLVLTGTREHRSQVVQLQPRALRRAFTVKQFGYLLAGAAQSGVTGYVRTGVELVERAAAARAVVPARTTDDDLDDPVGGPIEGFERCFDTLVASIRPIIDQLPD